jgi:ABC-type transporter Mla subunit MlaD
MHTLETLLDLADSYATITADPKTLTKFRAALRAALQEVLAERDTLGEMLDSAQEIAHKVKAERDALAKDAARFRYINELCSQVGRDAESIVRLIYNHQHLDALIADQHVAKGQTP